MNQVIFIDEEARSISLSSGRTVQITEAALATIMRSVKGLPPLKEKPKRKNLKKEDA
jgi:hypothetical protein|tara:strand:- start:282 stop:452 length:171 start_codon:yes stop_codon:yes gene_type:complete